MQGPAPVPRLLPFFYCCEPGNKVIPLLGQSVVFIMRDMIVIQGFLLMKAI